MRILQVEPALVADIKFIKPSKKSSVLSVPAIRQPLGDNTQITQRLASDADDLYKVLHAVVPSACNFTSVPIPEQEVLASVTNIPSEETVTSTLSEATVTSTPSEATVTSTSSEATVTSTPSEATVTSTPSKATITSTPSEVMVTSTPSEVPSKATVASTPSEVPSEATVTSAPSKATITSIPLEATVTSTPSEATVTSTPSKATITIIPSEATVTSTPSEATVTSTPSKATVASTPSEVLSEATVTSTPSEMTVTSMPSEYSETSANFVTIPAPLTALHKDLYYNMANDELEKEAEKLFCDLSISEQEAEALVDAIIMQQASAQWREQRNGRLTDSIFHDIYVRKRSTGPESLIKRVMGYEKSDLSHIPAIKWGVENECVARQLYTNVMSTKHDNFACKLTGLWVSPLYPHLGASPDGVTTCNCHGDGLVEIKCPFSAGMPIL